MRSSELGRQRFTVAALLLGAACVTVGLQRTLTAHTPRAAEGDDVSLVPNAERAKLLALGYDAAFADLLWSKLLVDYGTHLVEKRRFPLVRASLEAILALEPNSSRVFRFVDTLVLFQAKKGSADDARYVRGVLERGIDAAPTDPERWISYAQYLAYLGSSFLDDAEEIREWDLRGAEAFARALELGAQVDRTTGALSLFERTGAGAAHRAYLERAFALASDDERPAIEARLRKLTASETMDRVKRHDSALEAARRDELPGLRLTTFRLLRRLDRRGCNLPAEWSSAGCLE
jgi:hypothetical protein